MKLGLVGRNIQHSQSPVLFKKLLLGFDHSYNLIDIEDINEIKSIESLVKSYDGLNITSPFKSLFYNLISNKDDFRHIKSINCIKFKNNQFLGENTDRKALSIILNIMIQRNSFRKIVILGKGPMGLITKFFCEDKKIDFKVLSRSLGCDMNNIDFSSIYDTRNSTDEVLFVNCCSRDFIITQQFPNNSYFFDCNYSHKNQDNLKNINYFDGHELLELQAKYALEFFKN